MQALHTQPLSKSDLSLSAQAQGLHILAVASFGQSLTYPTQAEFISFAQGIGAGDVLAQQLPLVAEPDGSIGETYRRFSKTLVHFGEKQGRDRRLGLQYEWVKSDGRFTLLAHGAVAPHHPADLFCEGRDGVVTEHRLQTDTDGQVAPDTANAKRCLINAVFLSAPDARGHWASDWVSLFWAP